MFSNTNTTNDTTTTTTRRPMTRSFVRRQLNNEISNTNNKIITDEKPSNIINLINNSQISGKMPRNFINLPNPIIGVISERLHVMDYLYLLKRLDQYSVTLNYLNRNDTQELLNALRDIEERLMHFDNNNDMIANSQDESESDAIRQDSAHAFRLYGGIELLKRILLVGVVTNNKQKDDGNEKSCMLNIKCKCIQILNRLVCLPNYGKQVVLDLIHNGDTLIQYLFSLLLNKETRLQTCQLIDSILLHTPLLNLNTIGNFRIILEKIDDEGLSCMCKIFAVTLSDLDSSDNKYWAAIAAQRKQKVQQSETHIIRDLNQELLLSIPGLLYRLVNLVRRKDFAKRYANATNEFDHWMRYIDAALSDNDDNDDDNSNLTDASSTNPQDSFFEDIRFQPALLTAAKLNNFVHVLYTLSLLLIGKERKKVQRILSKIKLASALNSLFDYLIWNCTCELQQDNGMNQIRSHICPEVTVKIQFLRLVHSFCDNSEYKRVILTKEESLEVLEYNREAIPSLMWPEESLVVDHKLRCTKDKVGLLSKIVEVIKKESFSASFRFWLTRAIESYLRGSTSFADQLFLINRGLVEDTVRNVLAINFSRPKEVLQSSFDMLGELIKFNINGFAILNRELDNQDKFDMFLRMINHSLVDSNMFLRSIFLSVDFFIHESEQLNFQLSTYPILSFFDDFDKRIRYLCRMINTINIHNLSQENVSCLNTTLVVLMLANRKDQLPKYLKAIKTRSIEPYVTQANEFNNLNHQTQDAVLNFRDLLLFWQSHYLQKDKDCIGLEQNSKIDFKYWKYTVELLLSTETANPCSLNHYLESPITYLTNTTKIDEFRSD